MMNLSCFEQRAVPLGVLGLVVSQHGEKIAKQVWDDECRRNVYSASKSFTACAVGMAIGEGLLFLEEKLVDAFPEELPEEISDNLRAATVRDLLTMCLGQEHGELMGAQRPLYGHGDWVRMSLAFPFTDKPGTKFVYSNVGPYLAGILVQRRAGCNLVDYLMPRLFTPLGITRPTWETDPEGMTFGAGGLMLTMEELHRFGLLHLQKGCWNGLQLVPESWVSACMTNQVGSLCGEYGYGYLFWGGPHGSFRADGKYCQFSIVIPEKDAVITVIAQCWDGKALSNAIWEEIYPQL